MALQLLLAATLRTHVDDYDPLQGLRLPVPEGTRVRDLAQQLGIPVEEIKLVMVNGVVAGLETRLRGDERLALFPPVGGG